MSSWKGWLSLGCLVLGFLVALQFKQQEKEGFPLAAYRQVDLIQLVKDRERERVQLQAQIEDLRNRLGEYEIVQARGGKMSHVLARELRHTQLEAGLTPVKGPGVEVILDDSKRRPAPGEDPYFYIVHDVDLSQLTNELWAIGAEAIAINDERIVANSAVRCVGPTILINTRRISPPYHVKAIGDPDSLYGGLKMRGGFVDALSVSRSHGVTLEIAREDTVELPAYHGPTVFRYAVPVGAKP